MHCSKQRHEPRKKLLFNILLSKIEDSESRSDPGPTQHFNTYFINKIII